MSLEEKAELMAAIRQMMEEILLPELRQIHVQLNAMQQRLDYYSGNISQWVTPIERRCDRIERQVAVYQDVQKLKEQVAHLRRTQRPSA